MDTRTPSHAPDSCRDSCRFVNDMFVTIQVARNEAYKHQPCASQEGEALNAFAGVEQGDEHQYRADKQDQREHPAIVSLVLIAYYFATRTIL